MLYDMLYVLAKGGVTVFSGRPQRLRRHLNECQIFLDENQIPIEVLLKICARGYNDQKVLELSEKTNQSLDQYESRMVNELIHFPNGIPIRNKKFSFEELYHLFARTVIYIVKYNWVMIVGLMVASLSFSSLSRLMFDDMDMEAPDSCVSTTINDTNGCMRTPQSIQDTKLIRYNTVYLVFSILVQVFLIFLTSSITTRNDVKIFLMENRNRKYKSI